MKIKTTVDVEIKDIIDLICIGVEGGMMDWCQTMDADIPKDSDISEIPEDMHDFPRYYAPFVKGGAINFVVDETEGDEEPKKVRVGIRRIEAAMQMMADKYPHHFRDFIDDNSDAITGDVFVQLAVFEEVVFG